LIELRCADADMDLDFSNLVLPYKLDDLDHATIDERNRVGFFRILSNASDGNPSSALRLWMRSIVKAPDGKIIVRLPNIKQTQALESLDLTTLLVLRSITQCGMAAQDDIVKILYLPENEVAGAIRYLVNQEWIESENGFYYLNWDWFRPITRVLSRKNLLTYKPSGGQV